MASDDMKLSEDNKKLTFDWSSMLKLETPWKFGVHDVSMDLPLDYSLHPRTNLARSGVLSFLEEDLILMSLHSSSYAEEPHKVCELMWEAMQRTGCSQQRMFNKYVVEKSLRHKDKTNTVPSLVTFELGPIVWVIYNAFGGWPSIHRRQDLDDQNYLSYNQKGSDIFVWDNVAGMIRSDY